jgi:hypothetical protein
MMILKSLKDGIKNALSTVKFVASIVLPVMFVVLILEQTNIVELFYDLVAPLMSHFNLSGESALGLLLGNFINIYAALAVFEPMMLTNPQITIVVIMLLLSHSQITEGFIFKRLGVSVTYIISIRVISAIVVGWIVSVIL